MGMPGSCLKQDCFNSPPPVSLLSPNSLAYSAETEAQRQHRHAEIKRGGMGVWQYPLLRELGKHGHPKDQKVKNVEHRNGKKKRQFIFYTNAASQPV